MMLNTRYHAKVKTCDELLALIGPRGARPSRVIMCHGVFDVIHAGHLRHLLYAKSKADTLIVSVTADQFITKGTYRPHSPHDLRALNVAALECVDYVLVDHHPKPLENLSLLQPDYYAKGFEYSGTARPDRTIEEVGVVEAYGGEVLFTPGDVVFSSTKILNTTLPRLHLDTLELLMARKGITFDDLTSALRAFNLPTVHVVGDTIVDSLTHCTVVGGQTKTPTVSVRYDHREDFIGGAAIVAKHIAAAGGKAILSSVIGDDTLGQFVRDSLLDAGIEANLVTDPTRPTSNKNAIVVDNYRLLKVDTVDNSSISDTTLDGFSWSITSHKTDALVYADFRHGIFNLRTLPRFLELCAASDFFTVADSQVASRWGNIADFKGFDLITPNEREARFSLGDQDSGIRPLASKLYDAARCKVLMLKLGERGLLVCTSKDHENPDSFFTVDTFADHVVDPVGSGDALLAYATLSMLATGNPVIASILGTMAAACECEVDGNVPVSSELVLNKLDTVRQQL